MRTTLCKPFRLFMTCRACIAKFHENPDPGVACCGVGAEGGRGSGVRVLDIGCGANLIYPLLGAAMHGWAFVAADVTEPALDWAARNRGANPHLAPLIEVRRSGAGSGGSGAAVLAACVLACLRWQLRVQAVVSFPGRWSSLSVKQYR